MPSQLKMNLVCIAKAAKIEMKKNGSEKIIKSPKNRLARTLSNKPYLLCGITAAELNNSVDLLCGTTDAELYNSPANLLCVTMDAELQPGLMHAPGAALIFQRKNIKA